MIKPKDIANSITVFVLLSFLTPGISLGQNNVSVIDFVSNKWDITPETYKTNPHLLLVLHTTSMTERTTIFDTTQVYFQGFKIKYLYDETMLLSLMDKHKRNRKTVNKEFMVVDVSLHKLLPNGDISFKFLLFHINARDYNSKKRVKHIKMLGELHGILRYNKDSFTWDWVS